MALSTVSAVLRRVGMGKLGRLGLEQPLRYERHARESSFTSTSRSSAASRRSRLRVRGGAKHYNRTFTTATATAAIQSLRVRARRRRRLLTARLRGRCSKMQRRRPQSPSCAAPPLSTGAMGSACSASSAITDRATARRSTPSPVAGSASATFAPVPTGPRPTQGRALHPHSPARWPTEPSTPQAANAPPPLTLARHYNHRRKHSALGHQPPVTRTNVLSQLAHAPPADLTPCPRAHRFTFPRG